MSTQKMKTDLLGQWFLGHSQHPSRQAAVNLLILFIPFDCILSSWMLDASLITSVLLPLATHPVVAMENEIRLV